MGFPLYLKIETNMLQYIITSNKGVNMDGYYLDKKITDKQGNRRFQFRKERKEPIIAKKEKKPTKFIMKIGR